LPAPHYLPQLIPANIAVMHYSMALPAQQYKVARHIIASCPTALYVMRLQIKMATAIFAVAYLMYALY